ncbi:DUF2911 domain-containing protein [Lunatibacter salilacus]|uniref:DUF2911 domain-containing protein n=1 Tax=Lunatibacter salilacus TaxID=2483804 RepID=UPI00131AE753|nr:DUF2911 domain-containing protein [Lunatibacter salilacus]
MFPQYFHYINVFEPDHELDVVTVQAPVQQTASIQETFTININSSNTGATITFSWDEILFTVPIALQ